mmetsp:Transcript_589/g.2106  ORF Transcript_589/g.2106 Transcript_589/m.2106 type:complete len:119 (-) Transcript_589:623-979(-)
MDEHIPIILVGNKCDLDNQRQVSKEEGMKKAESIGCSYLETSAKTSQNVDEAFLILLEYITSKGERALRDEDNPSPLAIQIPSPSAPSPASAREERIKLGEQNQGEAPAGKPQQGCAC